MEVAQHSNQRPHLVMVEHTSIQAGVSVASSVLSSPCSENGLNARFKHMLTGASAALRGVLCPTWLQPTILSNGAVSLLKRCCKHELCRPLLVAAGAVDVLMEAARQAAGPTHISSQQVKVSPFCTGYLASRYGWIWEQALV
jgi:hypothetical protein